MLPTRSFAGVAHRAFFHPQVSEVLPMCMCSLIFCRLFDATRRRHPLRLLLDRKEAMYAFAYPVYLDLLTFGFQGKYTVTLIPGDGKAESGYRVDYRHTMTIVRNRPRD